MLALVILGGVLLMHGVAADHAMAMGHRPTGGTYAAADPVRGSSNAGATMPGSAEHQQVGAVSPRAGSHPMVAGCVAVLSTFLLPLLTGRRPDTKTRPVTPGRLLLLPAGGNAARSLWLLRPSLTRLGIAQT